MEEDEIIDFTNKEHIVVLIVNSVCNTGLRVGATFASYFGITTLLSLKYNVIPSAAIFGASYISLTLMLILCLIPDKDFLECPCYKCREDEE
jgi:hypothetical protein